MGKVQFLFFLYIIIISDYLTLSLSVLLDTCTHLLFFLTHSLTAQSIIQYRWGSLTHKPFSIYVTVLYVISPPAPFVHTVSYPAHFYCSFSLTLFSFCNGTNTIGQHSGAVISTPASQQEGPGFEPAGRLFCVEFVCSPHVLWGSYQVQKHAC